MSPYGVTAPAGRGRAAGRRVVRHPAGRPGDRPRGAGRRGRRAASSARSQPWTCCNGYYNMPEKTARGLAQPLVPHRRRAAPGRGRLVLLRRPATRTPSAAAARTSAPTRSSRPCSSHPAVVECAVDRASLPTTRPARTRCCRRRRTDGATRERGPRLVPASVPAFAVPRVHPRSWTAAQTPSGKIRKGELREEVLASGLEQDEAGVVERATGRTS